MSLKNLVTLLFSALSLYCFGGGFVERFQYSSWKLIPPTSFPVVHHEIELQMQRYYVPFLLLSVPVTIMPIWFHHSAMSRNLIILAAVLQTYIVASTLIVAVPIQRHLGTAFSQPLVDRLIWYHTYLRLGPGIFHLAIVSSFCIKLSGTANLWTGVDSLRPGFRIVGHPKVANSSLSW